MIQSTTEQTTTRQQPADINDPKQLKREIRAAMLDGDHERRTALEARYQQWRQEHAPELEAARQCRAEEEAAKLEKWKRYEADPLLMSEYLAKRYVQCKQANTEKSATSAKAVAQQQQRRAEIAESGQTPRGVQFADTTLAQKPEGHEYTPRDFCEALKWPKSGADAIRRALRRWSRSEDKRGDHWALKRKKAEEFWSWYQDNRHQKPHPPRRQMNSA
jgi:hypothetical protein